MQLFILIKLCASALLIIDSCCACLVFPLGTASAAVHLAAFESALFLHICQNNEQFHLSEKLPLYLFLYKLHFQSTDCKIKLRTVKTALNLCVSKDMPPPFLKFY